MQCPLDGEATLNPESGLQMTVLVCQSAWEGGFLSTQGSRSLTAFHGDVSAWTRPGNVLSISDPQRPFPGREEGNTGPAQTVGLGGTYFILGRPVLEHCLHCLLTV